MAESKTNDFVDFVNRIVSAGEANPSEQARRTGLQNEHLEALTAYLRSTTALRQQYAGYAFQFLTWWMACVGIFVALQGFGFLGFRLSDLVLSTIVGGTAVAVVGLAHAVIRGLFGKVPGSEE